MTGATAATRPGPILGWRIVPPVLWGARRGQRLVERNIYVYRRTWMILVSGFFEPVFYLVSIRLGLGALVGDVQVDGQTVSYAEFVAPALMATAAMNGALYDSTMNVFYKLKYARVYDAVLATPMGVGDVAVGEIGWALLRGAIYASGFLIVMTVMGLAGSVWVVACLPTALLIGFAFAAVGLAGATFARTWADFTWVEAVMVPLFLFSATFYPLSVYSPAAQWIVRFTPLYHGVVLCRAFSTGALSWGLLASVAYLLVMGIIGLLVSSRRLGGLLLKQPWRGAPGNISSLDAVEGFQEVDMLFARKKTEMVDAEEALVGRTDQIMSVPAEHFINGHPLTPPWPTGYQTLVVGLGCFWGAERKFWETPGVWTTAVGYAGGFTPNPTYEEVCSGRTGHTEAVLVVFDPDQVSLEALLKVFWESHDPTQGMRQGNDMGTQYRSAIYYADAAQHAAAEASRAMFQEKLDAAGYGEITTEIAPAGAFYYAEPYHQQYLGKNPNGYCGLGGTGVSCPIGVASAGD